MRRCSRGALTPCSPLRASWGLAGLATRGSPPEARHPRLAFLPLAFLPLAFLPLAFLPLAFLPLAFLPLAFPRLLSRPRVPCP